MLFTKVTLFIACFWLLFSPAFAQDQKIADSLRRIYQQGILKDTGRLELLVDLCHNEINDLSKALQYAEELITSAKRSGNEKYLRMGYLLKGNKKRSQRKLDEAVDAYFKSAELARKAHHVKAEGEAYGMIAATYAEAANFPDAMHYYKKSLQLLRQATGDSTNLAIVLSNVGDAFLNGKNYDSALLYFNEATGIFQKLRNQSGIGYSMGNIGMVYANIGQHQRAEKYINEAINILEGMKDYDPISVYLMSMSDVYLNMRDTGKALAYAQKSFRVAKQYSLNKQISRASVRIAEIFENTGNLKEALKHYKIYVTYKDSSIYDVEVERRMGDERRQFEVAQKQKVVQTLEREKRTILVSLIIILTLTVLLLGTLYWFNKSKAREKMRLHQQELLHARLEIQEQTYEHISQDLHDNIGQVLSVININLNTVKLNNPELAEKKLVESTALLSKAIQDLRDISKTLNTDYLHEISLPNAVDQQLQLLKRTGLYTTQLHVEGDAHNYGPERELLVFRVVQELLNNIVKHAGASDILVSMHYHPEKLIIRVHDNGKGFDVRAEKLNGNHGLGLRNIHNRLRLIRGSIFFESQPATGTTATVEIQK